MREHPTRLRSLGANLKISCFAAVYAESSDAKNRCTRWGCRRASSFRHLPSASFLACSGGRGSLLCSLIGLLCQGFHDLSVYEIDSEWPQSQFISFLERSSPPLQSFSLGIPYRTGDVWDDNVIQILQHIPSLRSLCLVYNYCEVDAGLFLEQLSPRRLDHGTVDCLIQS